ncbi:MAG TPA: ADP/ATP-dependent (S)-NAD(P)H-hydrate dehydratase, partial [Gemmatimonadaceae bacterium]|nr:ADP/ATP-dependent (S)-NAD(P)H-hydrate dehydratase [Gemmatimonadaceae bacterium]
DADALNSFEGEAEVLGGLLAGRPALVTPHPAEFGRLTGMKVPEVLAGRFDVGAELARTLNATVLLKGVPTVITAPDGGGLVAAGGTPALGAAGSGDVLSGIAGTLLAQLEDALVAGACAAWAHGRAGELAGRALPVRGVGLGDVIAAIARVWTPLRRTRRYPVLAELPAVGGKA